MSDETRNNMLEDMGLTIARPERTIPTGQWGRTADGKATLTLTFTFDSDAAHASKSGKSAILAATGNMPLAVPTSLQPALGGLSKISVSANVFAKIAK